MTFEAGKYYRHRNFLDVDIYVVQADDLTDSTLLGIYWTLQRNHGFVIAPETINVKKQHLDNWFEVRA